MVVPATVMVRFVFPTSFHFLLASLAAAGELANTGSAASASSEGLQPIIMLG